MSSTAANGPQSPPRTPASAAGTAAAADGVVTTAKIGKHAWVPNEMAASCYGCGAEFTLTRRKHHCRLCGNCFCATCSSKRLRHRKVAAPDATPALSRDPSASTHAAHSANSDENSTDGSSGSNTSFMGSLLKKTLSRATAALAPNAGTGSVKEIRVCDACFSTEHTAGVAGRRGLPGYGGANDTLHLESDDDDDESPPVGTRSAAALLAADSSSDDDSTPAASSVSRSGTARKGNLIVPPVSDDDDTPDSSTAAAPPRGAPARLMRTERKMRLDVPSAASGQGAHAASSASSQSAQASPASPSSTGAAASATAVTPPVHSPAACLFRRFFRVGAREQLKLVLPDPVLLYMGNKKHVAEMGGIGDGGIAGGLGTPPLPLGKDGSSSAHSGMGAIWNHLRATTHGHPCSHSGANHTQSSSASFHFDCSVPHISACARTFPFRYGMLAISNYQLMFIPMLVPPSVHGRSGPIPPQPFLASNSCTVCQTDPHFASRAGHKSAANGTSTATPIVTDTCCSFCGCVAGIPEWEQIANNSVASRRAYAARHAAAASAAPGGVPNTAVVPGCSSCEPIAPIALPLLSLSRFRLRTHDRPDLGELDVRTKGFGVYRFLLPGLVGRARFGSFRNIAVVLEYFSSVHKHEAAMAAAAAASAPSAAASASALVSSHTAAAMAKINSALNTRARAASKTKSSDKDKDKDDEGGDSSSHGTLEGLAALKKICFAFKYDRVRDGVAVPSATDPRARPAESVSAAWTTPAEGAPQFRGRRRASATVGGKKGARKGEATAAGVIDGGVDLSLAQELLSDDEVSASSGDDESLSVSSSSVTQMRSRRAAVHTDSGVDLTIPPPTPHAAPSASGANSNTTSMTVSHGSAGSAPGSAFDGWTFYNPLIEYARLGLLDPLSHYRLSTLNSNFAFAPTYPPVFVVPQGISDGDLQLLGSFRSKARIPCVVWARRNPTQAPSVAADGEHAAEHAAMQQAAVGLGGAAGGAGSGGRSIVANPEVVMLRSAQPMVGLTRARSGVDESFIQLVAASSPTPRRFLIADARPLANAMAQQVNGKGYEIVENYASHGLRECSIAFLDIGNIHVMRDAEESLLKLCQHALENAVVNAGTSGGGGVAAVAESCAGARGCAESNTNVHVHRAAVAACVESATSEQSGPISPLASLRIAACPFACTCACCSSHAGPSGSGLEESAQTWWHSLVGTGLLDHLGAILRGANLITRSISGGTSCLVHCSDGWDRTSQLTSLAQMQLDPYYRTLHGFFVLICKEWLSFGHKFTERVGHGGLGGRENSPVFAQWLDCVWQHLRQFPTAFEFTADLLLALRHSLYSGKYGTWFGNSECEREMHEWGKREVVSGSAATASAAGASTPSVTTGTPGNGSDGINAVSGQLRDHSPSVFTHLWTHRASFLNPAYEFGPSSGRKFLDLHSAYARNHPLQIDLSQLAFWREAYMCDEASRMKHKAEQVAQQVAHGVTRGSSNASTAAACTSSQELQSQLQSSRAAHSELSAQLAVEQAAHVSFLAQQLQSHELALAAQQRVLEQQKEDFAAKREEYELRMAEQRAQLERALLALTAQTQTGGSTAPSTTAAVSEKTVAAATNAAPVAASANTAAVPAAAVSSSSAAASAPVVVEHHVTRFEAEGKATWSEVQAPVAARSVDMDTAAPARVASASPALSAGSASVSPAGDDNVPGKSRSPSSPLVEEMPEDEFDESALGGMDSRPRAFHHKSVVHGGDASAPQGRAVDFSAPAGGARAVSPVSPGPAGQVAAANGMLASAPVRAALHRKAGPVLPAKLRAGAATPTTAAASPPASSPLGDGAASQPASLARISSMPASLRTVTGTEAEFSSSVIPTRHTSRSVAVAPSTHHARPGDVVGAEPASDDDMHEEHEEDDEESEDDDVSDDEDEYVLEGSVLGEYTPAVSRRNTVRCAGGRQSAAQASSISPPLQPVQWLDDKVASACPLCNETFGLIKRKHHCRCCGLIFCADCCPKLQLSPSTLSVLAVASATKHMTPTLTRVHSPPSDVSPTPAAADSAASASSSSPAKKQRSVTRLCTTCAAEHKALIEAGSRR